VLQPRKEQRVFKFGHQFQETLGFQQDIWKKKMEIKNTLIFKVSVIEGND